MIISYPVVQRCFLQYIAFSFQWVAVDLVLMLLTYSLYVGVGIGSGVTTFCNASQT